MPFDDPSIRTLLTKVKSGVYSMPECPSEPIKDLISHILVVDVNQRYNIEQIKQHPAFRLNLPSGYHIPVPLPAPNITQPIETDDKNFFSLLKNIGFESDAQIKEELSSLTSTTSKLFYYMYTEKSSIKSLPWNDNEQKPSPPLEPFIISNDEFGPPVYSHLDSPTSHSTVGSLYNSFKDSAQWVLPSNEIKEGEDEDGMVNNYTFDPYIVNQMELVAAFQNELEERGFSFFFPNDIMLIVHMNDQESYFTIQITQNSIKESVVSVDQVYGKESEFNDFISICEMILSKYEKKT